MPVYHESLDDPRGMIHIRDLMSWITTEAESGEGKALDLGRVDPKRTVAAINITREILYVPASMPVIDLLLKMQNTRIHLALVVDEYGGTDGLVSIEDLVEEVVGDIADEHDVVDEPLIRQDPRLGLVADARMPIEDLEKHLGAEARRRGGERGHRHSRWPGLLPLPAASRPRASAWRHPSGVEFEVLEANPRRIKKLRIHVPAGGPRSRRSEAARGQERLRCRQ